MKSSDDKQEVSKTNSQSLGRATVDDLLATSVPIGIWNEIDEENIKWNCGYSYD